jgi:hypothetical protein
VSRIPTGGWEWLILSCETLIVFARSRKQRLAANRFLSWYYSRVAKALSLNVTSISKLVFAFSFLISALYMAHELKRGWVPHDEGALGQSAERVLQGEIPHRDFDEIYTGGLSYLNAEAFRLFGTRITSPRYMLYGFFLAWVPSVYYIASRFASPVVAGIVTLISVAWATPNYAAAMPSWYNLYFASFGVASVLRYTEARSKLWLFLAGICGGVSFLFKVSGLFFVAGVSLYFLLPEEKIDDHPDSTTEQKPGRNSYQILVLVLVLLYNGMLVLFLRKGLSYVSFSYFVAPELLVGAFVTMRAAMRVGRNQDFRLLFRKSLIFGCGVMMPIAAFLMIYVMSGSVSSFFRGVFILPAKRFAFANQMPPFPWLFAGLVIDLAVITIIFFIGKRLHLVVRALVWASVPILILCARISPSVYRGIWAAVWTSLPAIVMVALILLMDRSVWQKIETRRRQQVLLLLSVTAACSLIQFPFSGGIYFCYVAPLVLLTATAVLSIVPNIGRVTLAGLMLFFLAYPVLNVTPGFIYKMGNYYQSDIQRTQLGVPRAGKLRVDGKDAAEYQNLGAIISQHAKGPYLFCTADCPEVYFLFGFKNPVRTLFDFFDDPADRTMRILSSLRSHNVNLVVLSSAPAFSGKVPADLREALDKEFPNHASTRRFEVRWQP